jgi:hypothetical protein
MDCSRWLHFAWMAVLRTLPPLRFPVIADAAFPCKYGTLVAELQRISPELSLTLNLMRNFKPLFRHSQVGNPKEWPLRSSMHNIWPAALPPLLDQRYARYAFALMPNLAIRS